MRSTWIDTFMAIAESIAKRSPDPSTQVGAVVVDEIYEILGVGFNGPPRKANDAEFNWERPHKYTRVIHAEDNAMSFALKNRGDWLYGCTLFTTHRICSKCALRAWHWGITRVVCGSQIPEMCKDEDWVIATNILHESGISLEYAHAATPRLPNGL